MKKIIHCAFALLFAGGAASAAITYSFVSLDSFNDLQSLSASSSQTTWQYDTVESATALGGYRTLGIAHGSGYGSGGDAATLQMYTDPISIMFTPPYLAEVSSQFSIIYGGATGEYGNGSMNVSLLKPGSTYNNSSFYLGFTGYDGGPESMTLKLTDINGAVATGSLASSGDPSDNYLSYKDMVGASALSWDHISKLQLTVSSIGYLQVASIGSISGTVVPEPSSLGLLALGATGLLARRRRA